MSERKTIVEPGEGWREELKKHRLAWTKRNLDEIQSAIENDVFLRASKGQKLKQIARWYGQSTPVAYTAFRNEYNEVFEMGRSIMEQQLAEKVFERAMNSNIPSHLIFAAKALAGMSDGHGVVVSTDEPEDENSNIEINVRVMRKEASED